MLFDLFSMCLPLSLPAISLLIPFFLLLRSTLLEKRHRYPPGPFRWPLVGCLQFRLPRKTLWYKLAELGRTYGPVSYLNILGQQIVVLNSAEAARELLDKRSSIYSDRPKLIMRSLAGYDTSFPSMQACEGWRQQRKIISRGLGPLALPAYHALQDDHARRFVHEILSNPVSLEKRLKLRIAAITLRVTYGYNLTSYEDPFLKMPIATIANFASASTPGYWLVEFIPALRYLPSWMPGAVFLRKTAEWRKIKMDTIWDSYRWSRKGLETGQTLLPNICSNFLAQARERSTEDDISPEDEQRLAFSTSSTLAAGMDTTVSAVMSFLLAMTLFPDVQEKGHEEIMRVIGIERLPSISDLPSLPYIRSIVAEVLRWAPPVPFGLPHAVYTDDLYNGMYIPKGSTVIGNVWSMVRNPEVYPNPDKFEPERYEGSDEEMAKVSDIAFGFGRRVCPGMYFAQVNIFAYVASMLATCKILPHPDSPPQERFISESGGILFPENFRCNFEPRSERASDLLLDVTSNPTM